MSFPETLRKKKDYHELGKSLHVKFLFETLPSLAFNGHAFVCSVYALLEKCFFNLTSFPTSKHTNVLFSSCNAFIRPLSI